MKNFRAFIFDWGNTLVNYPLQSQTEQLSFLKTVIGKLVDSHLIEGIQQDKELEKLLYQINQESKDHAVFPFTQRMKHFFGDKLSMHNISLIEAGLCSQIFQAAYPFEDSLSVVKKIKTMNYKIGIISNTPWGTDPRLWLQEIRRHGFTEELCDAVVFCRNIGYRKPHPAIFHYCIDRLGVQASESVFVGDSVEIDVNGAKNAGCLPVLIQRKIESSYDSNRITIDSLSKLIEYFRL